MNIYIGISRGKGIASKLIRFFTSLEIRRKAMVDDCISNIIAPFLIFLSLFNLTKYAKLKAEYNHTFLLYYSEDFNEYMVIEILENGIVIMPAKNTFSRSEKIAIVETSLDLAFGVKKTSKYLGKKYDYKGILGILWYIIKFIFTGIQDHEIIQAENRFFCSEYVATVVNNSGDINIGDPTKIYPTTFYKLTKELKVFNTLIEKKNLKLEDVIRLLGLNKQE